MSKLLLKQMVEDSEHYLEIARLKLAEREKVHSPNSAQVAYAQGELQNAQRYDRLVRSYEKDLLTHQKSLE